MSEPFLAEIRIVGFNYAPRGWAFCDGQILPIVQNQSLYSLLGTTYGGDGRSTFALPDIRGRTPIHTGSSGSGPSFREGEKTGNETHRLTAAETPQHTHQAMASSAVGDSPIPSSNVLASSLNEAYRNLTSQADLTTMRAGTVASTGGGQAHYNMQPFIVLNYCIALQGLFPYRN